MGEMIKMVVVLTVLSAFSGGLLASIRNGTKEQIEIQQLAFVKGPAIKIILEGASNDPIVDRFKMEDAGIERSFFVGKFDGEPKTVVYESFGKGYGGDVGLMVGVDITEDKIINVGVTTHSETPGLGDRAKTETFLTDQFKDLLVEGKFAVKPDGGQVDAIAGATITSRAVCSAVSDAVQIYARLKDQIAEKAKAF